MWCDAPLPLYFLLVVIAFCTADHDLGRMGAFDCTLSLLLPSSLLPCVLFFFQILLNIRFGRFVDCLFIFFAR